MKYWIWLSELSGTGPKLQKDLLAHFGNPEDIYNAGIEELVKVPGIGNMKAGKIIESRSLERPEKIERDCENLGIKMMSIEHSEYPKRLIGNIEMPVLLYYRGNPEVLNRIEHTAGIVGPRKCSRYGRGKAIEIAEDLTGKGYAIISGMALGADSYAHTACLRKDGFTVAVLGNGIDICFPSAHKDLKRAIEKRGLIISQYAPGVPAEEFTFPMRNKLIAGLSDEVYVVTPGRRSGSLITLEFAEKYGKKTTLIPDL